MFCGRPTGSPLPTNVILELHNLVGATEGTEKNQGKSMFCGRPGAGKGIDVSLIPIYMPKFGMTMEEGLIVEWLVAEGDAVAEGDGIVVIETEKVSTELEAPAGGVVVELSCEVDDEVPVGEVIGYIESA